MVFEAHGMSFQCTELLLFNYAKVNTVFHSMTPLIKAPDEKLNTFLDFYKETAKRTKLHKWYNR